MPHPLTERFVRIACHQTQSLRETLARWLTACQTLKINATHSLHSLRLSVVRRIRRLVYRLADPLARRFHTRRPLGAQGELLAARYLWAQGMTVIAHSYCCPFGEMDLIAVDVDTIVFVEVKTRQNDQLGHPTDAVHHHKRKRLIRIAHFFLASKQLRAEPARLDVVSIIWNGHPKSKPIIDHYPNITQLPRQ